MTYLIRLRTERITNKHLRNQKQLEHICVSLTKIIQSVMNRTGQTRLHVSVVKLLLGLQG